MSLHLFEAFGLFFGLVFGSFLNVCIARLPKHASIVHPGSHCPQCGTPIRWYNNIPILSWLLLRAHCRDCKAPISLQYPVVELLTGLWFALAARHLSEMLASVTLMTDPSIRGSVEVLGFGAVGFLLIGLLVMDWQTHLLPDAFTLTGIGLAAFLVCTQAIFLGPKEGQILLTSHSIHLTSAGSAGPDTGNVFLTGPEALVFGRLFAVVGVAAMLLLIRWLYQAIRHREGLGLGDVKLLAMIAAFLGFWPAILALFIGVLTATGYAVFLLVRGRAVLASKLPLGTFIALGGLISAQFGNRLIEAYATLLR